MLTNYLLLIEKPATQRFLIEHENDDEKTLALTQKDINGIPASVMASQLGARRKAKTKLPTWYKTKGIVYPPSINLEQCSSEATALFKIQIINSIISRKHNAADITGGFGVDSFFLSSLFDSFHYVEPDSEVFEITRHNHQQLGADNITHHHQSAETFISTVNTTFDLVYVDPSRRNEQSRKVFRLADCLPNIGELQPMLFAKCPFILLKASPLLDIQQGLREIRHVKKVYVVSVGNECKELLFLSENNFEGEPVIEAVDLSHTGVIRSTLSFSFSEERNLNMRLGEPEKYLYEPGSSVLKSGAFKLIGKKFNLTKLESNTHLYTSLNLVADFPGKIFLIEWLNPDRKKINELIPKGQVNVISRNYPLTPDEIKKKWHLRDGGEKFLIGFSSLKKKNLAICSWVRDT